MTTAEKITVGIALLGALGVGALLPLLVGHLLGRGEKKVNIADKSVQIAEALMSRMETELSRAQTALAKAEQEVEELRVQLDEAASKGVEVTDFPNALDYARATSAEISQARIAIGDIQGDVQTFNQYHELGHNLHFGFSAMTSEAYSEMAKKLSEILSRSPRLDQTKPDNPDGPVGTPAR